MVYRYLCLVLVTIGSLMLSCKHQPQQELVPDSYGNYPEAVGKILVTKCATAGCHNAASHSNAAGLQLDTWGNLFRGANSGAVVVPYSTDYSSLLYFINPDSALGIVAEPRMPLNASPITKEEYLTIRDWIANGAPDKDGNIAFGTNAATRQKIYAMHQGCDMVAVIDAESNLVMRYVPIGVASYPEAATYIKISPDGRYAYVSMWYDYQLYKIDTYTDKVVGKANMGDMFWSMLEISADGQQLIATNGDNFSLMLVNTTTMQVRALNTSDLENPLGITSNAAFDTFYTTSQFGNIVYKIADGYRKIISIDNTPAHTGVNGVKPDLYGISMAPDGSKYFVANCKQNDVRVLDVHTDQVIKILPVGTLPQHIVFSKNKPYAFISCMEDANANVKAKGSVYVYNYNTLEFVKKLEGRFFQPHGMSVDDKNNTLYIFNRNQDYDGPAPHHQGPCSGRNGFYTIYDLNTLEPVSNKRYEVLVDPYVSDSRFGS
jgi:YVTN family beta-propeller protein